jgi:hypothetical protein
LVLIFMVDGSDRDARAAEATGADLGVDLHGSGLEGARTAEATGANLGVDLHGWCLVVQTRTVRGGTHTRPARTLVLIFMVVLPIE